VRRQQINVITISDIINECANFHRHCLSMINPAIESGQQQTL